MTRIRIRIPEVQPAPQGRPPACRRCAHPALQRWGRVPKRVEDLRLSTVEAHRYHCPQCGHTFRAYPEGVSSWTQSQRTVALCALLWSLGLSLRAVSAVMSQLGVRVSRMSVLRDVRALTAVVRRRLPPRARVLGVDGMGVRVKGNPQGVLVAVEMGQGLPVLVVAVAEQDPQAVVAALEPLVSALGVEVLVSDDLGAYRTVAATLGLQHQVCYFHLRRWAGRALARLRRRVPERWRAVVEAAEVVLRDRPPDGGRRLFALYREVIAAIGRRKEGPLWQLAELLIRLSNEWSRYTLDRRVEGVPSTNNRVEQAIGRFRWRVAGMRGIKSWAGVEAAMLLAHVWPA